APVPGFLSVQYRGRGIVGRCPCHVVDDTGFGSRWESIRIEVQSDSLISHLDPLDRPTAEAGREGFAGFGNPWPSGEACDYPVSARRFSVSLSHLSVCPPSS